MPSIEHALDRFPWPGDLTPKDVATVVERVRREHAKFGSGIGAQSYWHTRIRRLIAEVQGRAKSPRASAPVVDMLGWLKRHVAEKV